MLKGQRKIGLSNPRDATHSTKKNETELAVGLRSCQLQDFLYKKGFIVKGSEFLGFQKLFFSGLLISPWMCTFEKEPLNGTKTKIVGVALIHCTPQEEIIT